jgi:hypothetical protein
MPEHARSGREGLVKILDAGEYVGYDYKTASKLLALLIEYGGDLNMLHADAADPCDLERRIMLLGQCIGQTTIGILPHKMRHRWKLLHRRSPVTH